MIMKKKSTFITKMSIWFFLFFLGYSLSFLYLSDSHVDRALLKPSFNDIFGTDDLGRSFFWVITRALGNSMLLSILAIGVCLGLSFLFSLGVQIFLKGRDYVPFRILEGFDMIPGFIWISFVMVFVGRNFTDVGRFMLLAFLVGVGSFPRMYRTIRGYMISLYKLNYIEGGRALGLSEGQVLRRYIIPELFFLIYPVLIQVWMNVLVSEGYLSFLGVGLRPTTFTLGSLLNRGWHYYNYAPHLFWIPSLLLVTIILLSRRKMRASLAGGPLKAQETDQ